MEIAWLPQELFLCVDLGVHLGVLGNGGQSDTALSKGILVSGSKGILVSGTVSGWCTLRPSVVHDDQFARLQAHMPLCGEPHRPLHSRGHGRLEALALGLSDELCILLLVICVCMC